MGGCNVIHWAYDCEPMKTSLKNLFLLPALAAGFVLILAGQATAQTFTTLHSFTQISTSSYGVYTNSDGADPYAGLILSGNTLYGTARTWRQFGQWHGVRRQHRWHGFYDPV